MEKIYINLEKEVFKGNVLDITYGNNSIIYNCNKYYDNFVEIGYLENNLNENNLNQSKENLNYYDTCVLFFALCRIRSFEEKKELFKYIYSLAKPYAYLYIWDLDRKPLSGFNPTVQVSMPDKTIVNMKLNNINMMSMTGKDDIMRAMEGYFYIEKGIKSKDVFKLICRRKEEQPNESIVSSG